MAQFEIRLATRAKVKGRLGWCGASGSGKTPSALLFAFGMTGDWSKVGMIDTEGGRGELYANDTIGQTAVGQYQYIRFDPPFSPDRYIAAISMMEQAVGPDGVIVIDSLSHAWEGSGGMIEQKDKIAASGNENDFTAWRKITPKHNELVDKILRCSCHIICNIRAKTEYALEKDERGKTKPVKIGMKPIFREGLDYEMTLYFDINAEHISTASKDNSHLFDQNPVLITPEHGRQFLAWLNMGEHRPSNPVPAPRQAQPAAAPANGGNGRQQPAPSSVMTDEQRALATQISQFSQQMTDINGARYFDAVKWRAFLQERFGAGKLTEIDPDRFQDVMNELQDLQAAINTPVAPEDPLDSITDPFAEPGQAAVDHDAESPEDVAGMQIERILELVKEAGLAEENGNWKGDMFRVLAHLGLPRKKLTEYAIIDRQLIITNLEAAIADPEAMKALLASRKEQAKETAPAAADGGPGF
jgi:hypothetical protein